MPVPSFTTNSPLCYNQTLTLDAGSTIGGISYQWQGPNGFTSSLQKPHLNNITFPAVGVYSLQVTAGPCVTGTVGAVSVYPLPTLSIVGATSVCETKTLTLNTLASPNVTAYVWFGPLGFVSQYQQIVRDTAQSSFFRHLYCPGDRYKFLYKYNYHICKHSCKSGS